MGANGKNDKERYIVYIGDDSAQKQNICTWLEYREYEFVWGRDVNEGLELASTYLPNLIVIGIQDTEEGIDMIRQLRSSGMPQLTSVPIIAISEEMLGRRKRHEMMKVGCNYYFEEPINSRKLQATVLAVTPR